MFVEGREGMCVRGGERVCVGGGIQEQGCLSANSDDLSRFLQFFRDCLSSPPGKMLIGGFCMRKRAAIQSNQENQWFNENDAYLDRPPGITLNMGGCIRKLSAFLVLLTKRNQPCKESSNCEIN